MRQRQYQPDLPSRRRRRRRRGGLRSDRADRAGRVGRQLRLHAAGRHPTQRGGLRLGHVDHSANGARRLLAQPDRDPVRLTGRAAARAGRTRLMRYGRRAGDYEVVRKSKSGPIKHIW